MSIESLIAVLPPPARPYDASGDFSIVEESLETGLPDDYKAFVRSYGYGKVCDFISIHNPFSSNEYVNLINGLDIFKRELNYLGSKHDSERRYDSFPAIPGLLPFAGTDNGDTLFWLVDGNPNDWRTVIGEARAPIYEEYELSFSELLAAYVSDNLNSKIIDSLDDLTKEFVPWPTS